MRRSEECGLSMVSGARDRAGRVTGTRWSARRATVAFFATVAIGGAVAGCGSSADSSATTTSTLTFVSWGGATQEGLKTAFVEPFAKESGVKVNSDGPVEYAKLQAQVAAGQVSWDVLDTDAYFPIKHCGTIAEPIDTSIVDVSHLPKEQVTECSVPLYQSTWMLAYDSKVYTNDVPTSWADFFDTAKYPGKRAVRNYPNGGALEFALLADGVQADQLYPLDYDRAFKKLDTIRDSIVFYELGSQQQQMLESGEVSMAMAWGGRTYEAQKNGSSFVPQWEAENLTTWDALMVTKGSKNVEAAMKLVAYATSPAAQAVIGEETGYAPVNTLAKPEVSKQKAEFFANSNPKIGKKAVTMDQSWYAENHQEVVERWTAWVVG